MGLLWLSPLKTTTRSVAGSCECRSRGKSFIQLARCCLAVSEPEASPGFKGKNRAPRLLCPEEPGGVRLALIRSGPPVRLLFEQDMHNLSELGFEILAFWRWAEARVGDPYTNAAGAVACGCSGTNAEVKGSGCGR